MMDEMRAVLQEPLCIFLLVTSIELLIPKIWQIKKLMSDREDLDDNSTIDVSHSERRFWLVKVLSLIRVLNYF